MSVSLWTAGATNEWLGPSPSNTVQLQGHTGSVYVCQFNPQGTILATAGHDRRVYLWVPNSEVGPTCDSVLMHHHCGPITGCAFSVDSANIVSCSADKTLSLWDTEEAKHIRRFRGHSKIVNSCSVTRRGNLLIASASDDGTVQVWDPRAKFAVHEIKQTTPITSVAISQDTAKIYFAGVDPSIKVWDFRKETEIQGQLNGHTEIVTHMSLSYDGSMLMTNSMDATLRIWDVLPVPITKNKERFIKGFQGHSHGFEHNPIKCSWNGNATLIASGSSDKVAYVWDFDTGEIISKLPGHSGAVIDVAIHPTQSLCATAGVDGKLFLGVLEHF